MIIDMNEFVANKKLREEVIPFFRRLNPAFSYFREKNDMAFVLNQQIQVVVFLTFIPRSKPTHLPTLQDSFHNIRQRHRVSTGEWVVEQIFECSVSKLDELMANIQYHTENPVHYLKKEMAQ